MSRRIPTPISAQEIAIHHAPEETANVMVRPEVRSLQPDQCPIQGGLGGEHMSWRGW